MLAQRPALITADFEEQLDALKSAGRRRRLTLGIGHDFASNDYLGLANSAELKVAIIEALSRGVPIGSGGSRLLRGNHPEHEMLEEEAARFFGSGSTLFFGSGYAANSALLSTLPQRADLILFDELIHASSHEGIRLARASARSVRHNDLQAFADELRIWRAGGARGRPWLVVESLYSMEGDFAPLDELYALAEKYDGFLIVDEAHATGVFGPHGRGLAHHLEGNENLISVRTCGKALGCEGALVCAHRTIRDFLINRGRNFIFSTAPSPLIAAAVRAALKIIERDLSGQERLSELVAIAAGCLDPLGARVHGSQILPVVIGDATRTANIAARIHRAGFDVRAIRPPTVPDGTSRLRISINLNIDEAAIAGLARALDEVIN